MSYSMTDCTGSGPARGAWLDSLALPEYFGLMVNALKDAEGKVPRHVGEDGSGDSGSP